jgi:hypothetical protein
MMSLEHAMQLVLHQPTPAALVALQGALLACGRPDQATAPALNLAEAFHSYLCEIESKVSAKELSELASRLDMGAVGLVALENLVGARDANFLQELILAALGEGLMVAASRQYIRAWQVETGAVNQAAAWFLSEALWRVSGELQPCLPAAERWHTIQTLLAPAQDASLPASHRALLLGRVFQLLLLIRIIPLLPADQE